MILQATTVVLVLLQIVSASIVSAANENRQFKRQLAIQAEGLRPLQALGFERNSSGSVPAKASLDVDGEKIEVHGATFAALNKTEYLGIPFAKPPVGDLRFKAPQPADYSSFKDTGIKATAFGPACAQPHFPGSVEDCLHINVIKPSDEAIAGLKEGAQTQESNDSAPTDTYSNGLPVLVWIHGGAFTNGATVLYDPSVMVATSVAARTPIIAVSFNYRLGVFGWPGGKPSADRNASMVGLQDQLLALKWIQDHISQFGGDPKKVTVFGESAGAISIGLHMINPQLVDAANSNGSSVKRDEHSNSSVSSWVDVSQPLFRGAILMSGAAQSIPMTAANISHQFYYDSIVKYTECSNSSADSFECLEKIPAEKLVEAMTMIEEDPSVGIAFGPCIDGHLVTGSPRALIAEGKTVQIPTIEGTVLDEGTAFVPQNITSKEALISHLQEAYKHTASLTINQTILETLSDFYIDTYGSPFDAPEGETFGLSPYYQYLAALFGDVIFYAPRRNNQQELVKQGQPTWSYLFSQPINDTSPLGTYHGSDLSYTFGATIIQSSELKPESVQLSRQMIAYLINFATYVDPNGSSKSPISQAVKEQFKLVDWPLYGANDQYDQLQWQDGNVTVIKDDYRDKPISYINSIPDVLGQ